MPAKPPPMMTTRFRSARGNSATAITSSGRVSANIALMDHLIPVLCHSRRKWLLSKGCLQRGTRPASVSCTSLRDDTERRRPYRGQEHREAQGSHDERDDGQDVLHGRLRCIPFSRDRYGLNV